MGEERDWYRKKLAAFEKTETELERTRESLGIRRVEDMPEPKRLPTETPEELIAEGDAKMKKGSFDEAFDSYRFAHLKGGEKYDRVIAEKMAALAESYGKGTGQEIEFFEKMEATAALRAGKYAKRLLEKHAK